MELVQFRMARAALSWTQRRVAQSANVSVTSVNDFSAGNSIPPGNIARIRAALEEAGIIFVEENGKDRA